MWVWEERVRERGRERERERERGREKSKGSLNKFLARMNYECFISARLVYLSFREELV